MIVAFIFMVLAFLLMTGALLAALRDAAPYATVSVEPRTIELMLAGGVACFIVSVVLAFGSALL